MTNDGSKNAAMPPVSSLAAPAPVPASRPVWIWVICAYVAIGMVTFPLSVLWMIQAGAITYSGSVTIAFGVLITVANIIAAVALIRLRKAAVTLFAVSLVLTGFATGWTIAQMQAAGRHLGSAVAPLFGFGILLLVYLYSSRLKRRGVLR